MLLALHRVSIYLEPVSAVMRLLLWSLFSARGFGLAAGRHIAQWIRKPTFLWRMYAGLLFVPAIHRTSKASRACSFLGRRLNEELKFSTIQTVTKSFFFYGSHRNVGNLCLPRNGILPMTWSSPHPLSFNIYSIWISLLPALTLVMAVLIISLATGFSILLTFSKNYVFSFIFINFVPFLLD